MTTENILEEVEALSSAEKEKLYLKIMDGYFRAMMNNHKFMEEAFHCMADYILRMKTMGLDVESILAEMEAGVGMRKAAAA